MATRRGSGDIRRDFGYIHHVLTVYAAQRNDSEFRVLRDGHHFHRVLSRIERDAGSSFKSRPRYSTDSSELCKSGNMRIRDLNAEVISVLMCDFRQLATHQVQKLPNRYDPAQFELFITLPIHSSAS